MGYDVGVYNSYGHRTISCSGFLRCFESEPLGDLREMVGSQLTSVEIVRSRCDAREESLRFLTQPLRSPYDSRTMLGVRPSFVYYQTCTTSQCIMARASGSHKKHHRIIQMTGKQTALSNRIVQFFEDRPYFYDISNEQ